MEFTNYEEFCSQEIGSRWDLQIELGRLFDFSQEIKDITSLEYINNRYVILKCVHTLLLQCPVERRDSKYFKPFYLDILGLVDKLYLGCGVCSVFRYNEYWKNFYKDVYNESKKYFRGSYIPLFDVSVNNIYEHQYNMLVTYIKYRIDLLEECLEWNIKQYKQ